MFSNRRGKQKPDRHGESAAYLIIGLGNPGRTYDHTRHNVGKDAIETLVASLSPLSLRSEKGIPAMCALGSIRTMRVGLAVPQLFMNESGKALAPLIRRFGPLVPQGIVVIHDELDLPVGSLNIKVGGGNAGHKGLTSIQQHIKEAGFIRIRIGIGKPVHGKPDANYVLGRPKGDERITLDSAINRSIDVLRVIVGDGVDTAMNQFNGNKGDG